MRKSMTVLIVAATAALAACAVNVAEHAPPPPAIDGHALVNARQGGMAMSVTALAAISSGVAAKASAKSYALPAKGLARFAQSLPALFDARTQGEALTKASPAIWSDPSGFAQRVSQYGAATENLLAAINANDPVATEAALATTKAACKACHDTYQTK